MDPSLYNTDKLGVQFSKSLPRLYQISMGDYRPAMDWIVQFVREEGYFVQEASLNPYTERWQFYGRTTHEGHDALLFTLPHDLMERIYVALAKKEWLPIDMDSPKATSHSR
jgi:hypothetical protein